MTTNTLRIAVLQIDLVWENILANRNKIDEQLRLIPEGIDIVFLPEMFSTGFTMNCTVLAEKMDGETIGWLIQRSAEYQLALCGSLIIQEGNLLYNRLVFVEPSGKVEMYDKRHLFTMAREENYFESGQKRLIVEYKGWRICPLICYDLRFPVWSRNLNEYDLLFYAANWPESRKDVWNTLLKARAIENQSYVVGANRVGVDGNKISYSGNSQVIGPKGNIIASVADPTEYLLFAEIFYDELIAFRKKFPVLNDADRFEIK